MPVYCFLSSSELYPFAPYSMYSHKHEVVGVKFFRFYCQNTQEFLLTNEMIRPFDEARLTQSVESAYFSGNASEINERLESLMEVVSKNKFQCNNIVLKIKNYHSPKDFLSEQGEVLETFSTGTKK